MKLLDHAPGFSWINHSMPTADPALDPQSEAGRRALRDQIAPVHCVVIVAAMYTRHPEWVRTEMRVAKLLHKNMVGVRRWGEQWVSPEVASAVDEMAFWNTPSITSVIRRWAW